MTNEITPPRELVEQLEEQWCDMPVIRPSINSYMATKAAQWGADQELEACCEWFICDWTDIETADKLRAARSPKPPSLKKQALAVITNAAICDHLSPEDEAILRRALEALDD